MWKFICFAFYMILDCFYKILCRLISNIQSVNSNYYVLELNKTVVLFILYLSIVYLFKRLNSLNQRHLQTINLDLIFRANINWLELGKMLRSCHAGQWEGCYEADWPMRGRMCRGQWWLDCSPCSDLMSPNTANKQWISQRGARI